MNVYPLLNEPQGIVKRRIRTGKRNFAAKSSTKRAARNEMAGFLLGCFLIDIRKGTSNPLPAQPNRKE